MLHFSPKTILRGQKRSIDTRKLAFSIDNYHRCLTILITCCYFEQNNVPEIFDSTTAFEGPPSPDSSYGQTMPSEEDFAKEPVAVPLQLPIQFDMQKSEEAPSCSKKPRHVVLNHMFMDTSYTAQSVVALGVTHRFESKYVTVFLYKPLKLAAV